jgi:hypothetical protein
MWVSLVASTGSKRPSDPNPTQALHIGLKTGSGQSGACTPLPGSLVSMTFTHKCAARRAGSGAPGRNSGWKKDLIVFRELVAHDQGRFSEK